MTAPRFLLVDTNTFLRLYRSPVLPLLGEVVGDFKLMTLDSLIEEFIRSTRLVQKYPRVAVDPKLSDLKSAGLKLRGPNKRRVDDTKNELGTYVRMLIGAARAKKSNLTPLSRQDMDLLSTAVVLKAGMATDEGALRFVARKLMEDPDAYPIILLNSVEVLHLLEANGRLSAEQRRATVDAWIRSNELLSTGWRQDYERLFGEPASSVGD